MDNKHVLHDEDMEKINGGAGRENAPTPPKLNINDTNTEVDRTPIPENTETVLR